MDAIIMKKEKSILEIMEEIKKILDSLKGDRKCY